MANATQHNKLSGWECAKCGLPLRISDTMPGGACPDCGSEESTSSFLIGG